ncbi:MULTISPECIES: lactonase family protein [Bradyrhizobium]|nr:MULTISPECIES: beta-propeller fold lactonase family protein [Bradyrhizobium]MCG2628180.1 lactonase family protein [Bradyrhizobium zhengyangense]MCG2643299.1 lactonase family protein [Bradyrhizobium zhengyangense]MCG2670387.1 lactonase family protein [Bradyrhizobium zhengyangense]MDN4985878.1 beta-propeller fold lactonase family protein [Bradyrhizobium sp. WYCCWR 13022]MDN5002743.1 beta-propeller fold lactonase family protein [Bradyrhizobium sp. WYCCWR 12677]
MNRAVSLSRRTFVGLLAAAGLSPRAVAAQNTARAVLYVAVGSELMCYEADDTKLALQKIDTIRVPEAVQYAWKHPSKPLLYVAFSNRYTSKADDRHGVAVYAIDQDTGRLQQFGEPVFLKNRPVNLTLDPAGRYLLVAYNMPSDLTVHALGENGSIGVEIKQSGSIDAGIYAHQVRVSPSGKLVVLPTRGNDPGAGKPEDPGALKVFRFEAGQLSHETSITKGNGLGFGPRHVDFHPEKPWMFVSMERNNQLLVYGTSDEGIDPKPLFERYTAENHEARLPVQFVGPIHVHPNGRFVYLANRSDGTIDFAGRKVHGEGENTVAVFSINPASGEPTLIQTIDTLTFHCRTFSIHPAGRMLVTAAVAPLDVRDGGAVRTVPAGLTVFDVADDGKLNFARKYEVDIGKDWMFWCGMVAL